MRQRLGIAQAMLGNPRVLILDEPANGLDPAGIREIRELIRGLAAERGMAVFVSSHLLAEIELIADRVAIIHKGRILRVGPVKELISAQRTMELKVGDVDRAVMVLRDHGVASTIEDDLVFAAIDEPDAPPLIAALAQNGVEIFHARRRVQSLEEMFLEITGGESVD
jgi:ABC-2 type transport system ATP-binding protein